MKRFFGCHVSASGGLKAALDRGTALEVNTIQIHPSAPQRYVLKPFANGLEDDYLKSRIESSVEKLFFHSIYLINLANPDSVKRALSIQSLVHELDFAARCEADGVIFHVGSLKDEPDEEAGLRRCAEAVTQVLEKSDHRSRLLLEVSAGSGKVVGARLEQLSFIFSEVKNSERLGFALDTQHMWASGYNWQLNLEEIVNDLEAQFGIKHIHAIHLNDSKSALSSRIDRHANLGEGLIGYETLAQVVNHEKFRNIPFILETPRMKSVDEAAIDVTVLREMIGIK
jgi:deoxyribonuclease-4